MAFFISYSRHDDAAVRVLIADLERTHRDTWLDQQLGGGEEWWQEILDQIRRSEVFVLALSDHSLTSRPCRAELDYAMALGIPVLPVQVGEIGSLRTLPIAERQVVDFRERARTYTGRSPIVDTSILFLRRLRRHPDATYRNVQEIDEMLSRQEYGDLIATGEPDDVAEPEPTIDRETDHGPRRRGI